METGPRLRQTLATVAAVAGILLMLGLAAWAASVGPSEILAGDGSPPPRASPAPNPTQATPSTSPEATGAEPRQRPPRERIDATIAVYLFIALVIVCAIRLLYLLLGLLELQPRGRRPEASPVEPEDLPAPRERLAKAMTEDAEEQRELLMASTPRNGIVACWHRFEQQASAAGARPQRWETSTEFSERILREVGAEPAAIDGLAQVFRTARFSSHPVSEADRAAAVELLDRVHRSLGARR